MSPGLFSVSCSASEERHKKPGESMARTADLNSQRDIPYHRTLHPVWKIREFGQEGLIATAGWAGQLSAGSDQLSCALLLYLSPHLLILKLLVIFILI